MHCRKSRCPLIKCILLPSFVFQRTPCLQIFAVLFQSHISCLLAGGWSVAIITCDTLRGVCTSFHVVDVSEDDCERQVSSCGRVCCLFIDDDCEETLLLPGSAHKIIWAFQGLKETGTVFWTTIPMSESRCSYENSRV